jgi:prepilin signal peptidase PulO-like enzyme (type II secretory pathway)
MNLRDLQQKTTDYLKKLPKNLHINNILNFINLILIYALMFSVIFSLNFKINILKFSLSSQLLVYLVLFLVYKPLSKLLTKYKKINPLIFLFLIIAGFFVSDFWLNFFSKSNPFIRFFGGFFVFIIAIQLATKFVSNQTETKKIKSEELRPNMLLGEETINILKQDKEFFQKELDQMYFDGLSQVQVEKIKTFFRAKNLEEIEICRTFPFAPFIFIGTIITLIIQGSLLNWLTQFLR